MSKKVTYEEARALIINQVKHLYPDLRSKSKSPTFA